VFRDRPVVYELPPERPRVDAPRGPSYVSTVLMPDILTRVLHYLRVDGAELARHLVSSAIILTLAWAATRLLRVTARRIERRAAAGDPLRLTEAAKRGRTLAQLVQSIGGAVVGITAALLVLSLFVNVGPLLAGAGIVTLAISFGAQGLVKDVIAGVFMLAEDQFRVGETIRVNGVEGKVERMTLRTVTLRQGDGTLHFIANGSVGTVSNVSRDWSRATVEVGVAYKEDVDRVLAVLRRLLHDFAADPAWKGAVVGQPTVGGIERLADSSVEVRLWVDVYPGRNGDVERELRRRIKKRFDEEGIEIPLPQRVIHTVTIPAGTDLPRA